MGNNNIKVELNVINNKVKDNENIKQIEILQKQVNNETRIMIDNK